MSTESWQMFYGGLVVGVSFTLFFAVLYIEFKYNKKRKQ